MNAVQEALGYHDKNGSINLERWSEEVKELFDTIKNAFQICLQIGDFEDRKIYMYWNGEVKKMVQNETWEKILEEADNQTADKQKYDGIHFDTYIIIIGETLII